MAEDEVARLLESLADLRLPDTGGVAPVWWLLGAALGAAALALAVRALRRRRSPGSGVPALAAARAELGALRALLGPAGTEPPPGAVPEALARASTLARRLALAAGPRERVAALRGARWLAELDALRARGAGASDPVKAAPGRPFSDGPGRWLASAPYERAPSAPRAELEALFDALDELAVAVTVPAPETASASLAPSAALPRRARRGGAR